MKFDTFYKQQLKNDPRLREIDKISKKIDKILDENFDWDDEQITIAKEGCAFDLLKLIDKLIKKEKL
jgi:hypothetical protein